MTSYYDDLVNDFALMKFREHWTDRDLDRLYLSSGSRHAIQHQLKCPDSTASVKRAEWECGCLSEVTREDMFVVTFIVSCNCGVHYQVHTSLDLGHENLMDQLAEYDDLRSVCEYERMDYRDDDE